MDSDPIDLTGTFVLPEGVVLSPVRDLPKSLRQIIGNHNDDDVVVGRRNSRARSKLLDLRAATLVAHFRTPQSIAYAIARFSRERRLDAEATLEEALPMLRSLIEDELLVPSSKNTALPTPLSAIGDQIDGWTVLRRVQALEDAEIYQIRRSTGEHAALKIGRPGHAAAARSLEHEAQILSNLDLAVTPRMLSFGSSNSRRFLITEWIAGRDSARFCQELRRARNAETNQTLFTLMGRILHAYATLHQQGVVHGDVHPRNVLIDRGQTVKILDFGAAQQIGNENAYTMRAGVSFFFEPEFAEAARSGAPPPLATPKGEQYSLAVLIYFLLTGRHYLDFTIEKHEMLRQIAEDSMIPFSQRKVPPWPEAERVLEKALSKTAAERFESVAAFALAWERLKVPERKAKSTRADGDQLLAIRRLFATEADIGGPLMKSAPLAAPSASLNYGSTGIACALYHISCALDDGKMLAAADVWAALALEETRSATAFYNDELQLNSRTIGSASLYHGRAGLHAVRALIARARGDEQAKSAEIRRLTEICSPPHEIYDLASGYAGALLGCALLIENDNDSGLQRSGDDMLGSLLKLIDLRPAINDSTLPIALGMAHGWSGVLYASLCWSIKTGQTIRPPIERRLREFASLDYAAGHSSRWQSAPGWCNGSAGLVFLWTTAYRAMGDGRYLELAERAARGVWETRTSISGLCCGLAGQSYALLNLYRFTGDSVWLGRARSVASKATVAYARQRRMAASDSPETRLASLYKGGAGIAVLSADLERPDEARMPMFECEF